MNGSGEAIKHERAHEGLTQIGVVWQLDIGLVNFIGGGEKAVVRRSIPPANASLLAVQGRHQDLGILVALRKKGDRAKKSEERIGPPAKVAIHTKM